MSTQHGQEEAASGKSKQACCLPKLGSYFQQFSFLSSRESKDKGSGSRLTRDRREDRREKKRRLDMQITKEERLCWSLGLWAPNAACPT